jgi:hypothetical protein
MIIINLKNFLALSENTLFSTYNPNGIFGELEIKGETLDESAYKTSCNLADNIHWDDYNHKLPHAEITGESMRVDIAGCQGEEWANDDQLFAVWEDQDIRDMIHRLGQCIKSPL